MDDEAKLIASLGEQREEICFARRDSRPKIEDSGEIHINNLCSYDTIIRATAKTIVHTYSRKTREINFCKVQPIATSFWYTWFYSLKPCVTKLYDFLILTKPAALTPLPMSTGSRSTIYWPNPSNNLQELWKIQMRRPNDYRPKVEASGEVMTCLWYACIAYRLVK